VSRADVAKAGSTTLLNGHSLSHLVESAVTKSRVVTETRVPASLEAELRSYIKLAAETGQLQVNFHKGRALDLKFVGTREARTEREP